MSTDHLRYSWALAALTVAVSAGGARAQTSAGVEVSLTPESGGNEFRYVFEVRPAAWSPVEVVADRRLLSFVVHPEGSRRSFRCRHPDAPRAVSEPRIRRLGAGADLPLWREWIDLRMYCWGRAAAALESGARVEVQYGFRSRGRARWVARPIAPSEARPLHRVVAAGLVVAPRPSPAATDAPIEVALRSTDSSSGDGVSFGVTLAATAGRRRVYMRDDLLSFVVDGPLGSVLCETERQPIVPIIDFFQVLRGRSRAGTSISASAWCPAGTFDLAGIYEVTPRIELVYDGSEHGLDALTGTFVGRPTSLRVRRGSGGYQEQIPAGGRGAEPPGT